MHTTIYVTFEHAEEDTTGLRALLDSFVADARGLGFKQAIVEVHTHSPAVSFMAELIDHHVSNTFTESSGFWESVDAVPEVGEDDVGGTIA